MNLHDQIKLPPLPDPILAMGDGNSTWNKYNGSQMKAYARHAAAELALASDARIKELEAALTKAVVQNSHDMLLTGEELRECEKILKGQP